MNYRILLVEDEEHLRDTIKLNLELEGYSVIATGDGLDALNTIREGRFNLVILDIMIPTLNGLDVCERIRLENRDTPILILSAKNSSDDRVKGLKLGANDYLTKPFNLEELLLRVGILIKSGLKGTEKEKELYKYRFGENEVDFSTFTVTNNKGSFQITKRETMLLKLLIEKKDQVVSREQILEKVWGYDVFPSTRTIDNFILAFRKYFEVDPKNPKHLHSVRGVGYKFTD
jgi:two-component system alkaline phosphatase synthesis response regulator PhoP